MRLDKIVFCWKHSRITLFQLIEFNEFYSLQRKQNGVCVYGSQECWFKHQSEEQNIIDDEISGIKTVELVKRLFDMMKVFAKRISQVENQMWLS